MAIDRTNPTVLNTGTGGNTVDDVAVAAAAGPTPRRRQVFSIGDPDNANIDKIAAVKSAAPATGDNALVTRTLLYDSGGNAITFADPGSGIVSLPVYLSMIGDTNLRGLSKGTTSAVDATVTTAGANHNALDVTLYDASGTALLGQKTMAGSQPIVIASDQSNVPANIAAVGGTNVKTIPTNGVGQAAVPVWANAVQLATYKVVADNIVSGALTANTAKAILSLEHSGTATKTVKIRRISIGGWQTTALAGVVYLKIMRGTAASSAGTAITPVPMNPATTGAEVTAKSLPTITAATGPLLSMPVGFLTAAANTGFAMVVVYDWQEGGETQPITLRVTTLDALSFNIFSNVAHNLNLMIQVVLTEE